MRGELLWTEANRCRKQQSHGLAEVGGTAKPQRTLMARRFVIGDARQEISHYTTRSTFVCRGSNRERTCCAFARLSGGRHALSPNQTCPRSQAACTKLGEILTPHEQAQVTFAMVSTAAEYCGSGTRTNHGLFSTMARPDSSWWAKAPGTDKGRHKGRRSWVRRAEVLK